MRSLIFIRSILCPVALSVFPISASAQTISIPSTEFDFGEVRQGEKVVHEFKFTNTGSNDLVIRKINSSCGCVAAVADNATISSGSSSSIRVTFDTTGFSGSKLKSVRIYSNDSANSSVVLKIGAKVQPEIVAVPSVLQLMDIRKNETKSGSITFQKLWGTDPKITEVISKSQHLAVSFNKDTQTINVKVDPQSPLGISHSRISIKTDSKSVPVLNVPVVFEVVGNLAIEPKTLNFGLIDLNRTASVRRVKITRKDGKDIGEIKNITNDNRAVNVDTEPQGDGKSITLVVSVNDKSKPIVRGLIGFKIQDDDIEYSVPYYGVVDGY